MSTLLWYILSQMLALWSPAGTDGKTDLRQLKINKIKLWHLTYDDCTLLLKNTPHRQTDFYLFRLLLFRVFVWIISR